MDKSLKVFVAGHRGMVGSALVRKLQAEGFTNIITRSSKELDLRNQAVVEQFFAEEKIGFVFLAAAKVGGILANNTYRGEFLYDNLMIQNNVIHQSYVHGVKKLVFLGSTCIYPKFAEQPIKESSLLTGALEPTNEPYAIAKIAGIKMCETYRHQYGCDFISVMPTNLYGPGDNYDLNKSHVLPALVRKFSEAVKNNTPTVEVWGTGSPMREFLHVDDLASAVFHLFESYSSEEIVNIGTGVDITIKDLVETIQEISGFQGKVIWDTSKPDGTPKKVTDASKLHSLGWKHTIELREGIEQVFAEYHLKND